MIARQLAIPIAAVSVAVALAAVSLDAQRHHYRRTTDWGQLPPGTTWGEVTSVDIAPDGTVFVLSRCFAKDNNGCIGRDDQPADPEVRQVGQAAQELGTGHVRVPARRVPRPRRQLLGDRLARRDRQGTPGRSSSAATASC